jgi:two-component system, sensor histidine kinase and response regulator
MDKPLHGNATSSIGRTILTRDAGGSLAANRRPRVLVVEDNPLNAKLVLAQLEQDGFEAVSVKSGEAALDALAAPSYSLVLMDCEMPGMDGCATTREIRRREAAERHTLIVGLSSNRATSSRARCMEAGMDDYIERPVTASQLMRLLHRLSAPSGSAAMLDNTGELSDPAQAAPVETLDAGVLAELAMLPEIDGSPLLFEMVGIVLGNLPAMLHNLSVAGGASPADVARAAHYLKSSCATIGAKRLATISSNIEKSCGKADPSALRSLLVEAREEAARLVEKLKMISLALEPLN